MLSRKKKKQMAHEVAIYNPNGHSFLPGLHGMPKTIEDDDAHIYDYIEDTLVYGHLLRDELEMDQYGAPAVDTYQPFNGPTETTPLKDTGPLKEPSGEGEMEMEVGEYRLFIPPTESAPPASETDASQEDTNSPTDLRLVENDLYSVGRDEESSPTPLTPCPEALQAPVFRRS